MNCSGRERRALGVLLALGGMLIIFLCLPMQFFLIALGAALTVAGFALLR